MTPHITASRIIRVAVWKPGISGVQNARFCCAGTIVPNGAKYRYPLQLDPVQAAFNIGADPLARISTIPGWRRNGVIRPITSAVSWPLQTGYPVKRLLKGKAPLPLKRVLTAMIKAHEIQGCWHWKTHLTKSALTMLYW